MSHPFAFTFLAENFACDLREKNRVLTPPSFYVGKEKENKNILGTSAEYI